MVEGLLVVHTILPRTTSVTLKREVAIPDSLPKLHVNTGYPTHMQIAMRTSDSQAIHATQDLTYKLYS